MHHDLPAAVTLFFAISNSGDTHLIHECFAQSAVVVDEKHTYVGIPSIQAWLADVKEKYAYTATPTGSRWSQDTLLVDVLVEGRFPSSPAHIEHEFRLEDERIAHLEMR